MKERELVDELEYLVDQAGLSETVHALMVVCSEKAGHIRSSYDDEDLADEWEDAADQLQNIEVEEL